MLRTPYREQTTDHKGTEISQFIRSKGSILSHNANTVPTFESTNGRSWIDLIMVSESLTSHVDKWEVLEDFTNSGHR